MFALAPFLSYAFVATFTPGPNNIMSLSIAGRYGWRRTHGFTCGVAFGFTLIMLLCAFANLLLYNVLPRIQVGMNVLGAVYMGYLALKLVKSSVHVHGTVPQDQSQSHLSSFWQGFVLQFVNVKVILYGLTIMGSFIMPHDPSPIVLVAASTGLALLALVATNSWALFGSVFQRFLAKHEKPFNAAMAVLLVYCAVSLFLH